ncbi:MAG: GGDEF domain-containing protein [Lachnospira sp.]
MDNTVFWKIVMKTETFDIVTADKDFYSYMRRERLYFTFDKLISEDNREIFYNFVKRRNTGKLILDFDLFDGSREMACVNVSYNETGNVLKVCMALIKDLFDSELSNEKELNITNKMIDLYEDILFRYYPDEDKLILSFYGDVSRKEETYTIDEFEHMLMHLNHMSNNKLVGELISYLTNGAREYTLKFNGKLFDNGTDAKLTIVRGTSIYEDGKYQVSAGFIHQGSDVIVEDKKKVERDSLTGVLTKGEITNYATRLVEVEKRQNISIAIADIDYFKRVNDTFGHMAGDDLLKSVASIIEAEVGDSGVVGRFGGDEFFIIFYDAYDMENCREILRSIKNTVNATYPPNEENKPAVTLSIGCAAYPKDADNYVDLFYLADFALYRAKEKGRNRYIIYNKNLHGTIDEIKATKKITTRINSRGDMSMGDILCIIMDKVYNDSSYTIENLLDDCAENFGFQRIMVYSGSPYSVKYAVGESIPNKSIIAKTEVYTNDPDFCNLYDGNELIINDIKQLCNYDNVTKCLVEQRVLSFIHIRFIDKAGNNCILSIESVSKRVTWNESLMSNYRLIARLLAQYDLS